MASEYVNNPCDHTNERYSWMEKQVADKKCNVNLLMVTLSNKIGIFGENDGSMQRTNQKENKEIMKK